jgi:hypothetical protein
MMGRKVVLVIGISLLTGEGYWWNSLRNGRGNESREKGF